MIRFAIALMVGGALLTFFGYREFKLSSAASSEAQSISASDIFANGYCLINTGVPTFVFL